MFAYDWTHNLVSVREYNSSSSYYLTSYGYDYSGNLVSVKDAKNHTTTYQYDDLNRQNRTNYPDGTSQAQSYDSVGDMVSNTNPNGQTVTYGYDSLNRMTNSTYGQPGSPTGDSHTLTTMWATCSQ